jgi:ligand-binding sensor domain-containing protein
MMHIRQKTAALAVLTAALLTLAGCGKSETPNPSPTAPPSSAAPATTAAAPAAPEAQPAAQPAKPAPVVEGAVAKASEAQKIIPFHVPDRNVKSIYAEGKVAWIGTTGGIVRYDTSNDSFKSYHAGNGLLSNGVFFVGKLKGKLAVGTYGGGLSLLQDDGVNWKNYNVPDGVGDPFVYGFIQAKNGDIWIATWSGANRVRGGALDDPSKWDLYTVESTHGGLPNDWVYGVTEGKNGDIWFATEGGVARFANGKWNNWNHEKGVGAPYEKVKSEIEFKNDPSKFSEHHARQKQEMGLQGVNVAYNPNYIISLVIDNDGIVWAGTWGGGLSRFDGAHWRTYTTAEGLPGNHVFMLHKDVVTGQIWIGTNKGLAQMQKNGKFKVWTRANGLFADNVFSMASTPDGSRWIGSYGGGDLLRPAK